MSEPDSTAPERDDNPELTALSAASRQSFGLRERIALTYEYHGGWALVLRVITFPLRFTPLKRYLDRRPSTGRARRVAARRWYRELGRPVTIVIPSYKDADDVANLVASLRRTTDARAGAHRRRRRRQRPRAPRGAARDRRDRDRRRRDQRGLRRQRQPRDPRRRPRRTTWSCSTPTSSPSATGWRACSTRRARAWTTSGSSAPSCSTPTGASSSAARSATSARPSGSTTATASSAADFGPANVPGPMLAVSGACMYLTREVLDEVGLFDEAYPMAYEDVDLCLRAWQAGFARLYWPAAELRPPRVGHPRHRGRRARAGVAAGVLGSAGATSSTPATSAPPTARLRVVYVTEDTGVGGGHRDIFEHLNGLRRARPRGRAVDARRPARLVRAAAPRCAASRTTRSWSRRWRRSKAIKVATWWNTRAPVWEASVLHGIPVYFVQDIETSYYADNPHAPGRRPRLLPATSSAT